MRLRKSDPREPGYQRKRSGKGFRYLTVRGATLKEPGEVARVKALAIPPAWKDVWVCADPRGHLQATGVDDAGRTQYLYHEAWRVQQDQEKFDHMLEFAEALPTVRDRVAVHLAGRGLTRNRVLAASVRLLDVGLFRAGGEDYARENGTYGLATLLREHVRCGKDGVEFDYVAKSAQHRVRAVTEPEVCKVVQALRRRPDDAPALFSFWERRAWHPVHSGDVNDYLREIAEGDFTAKDFRTWHGTVLAAIGLAVSGEAGQSSESATKKAIARVVAEVAHYLGNTPAVARASYIDPRLIDLYEKGRTIDRSLSQLGAEAEPGEPASRDVESAVVRLLRGA